MVKISKLELYFIVKFFILFSVLQLIILFWDLTSFQQMIASIAAGWANLRYEGIGIFVEDGVFLVTKNCTGWVSSFILGSIVFSLKKPELPKKVLLFVISTIALLIINLFRIYFVIILGANYGLYAGEIVHIISWFVMSGVIIAIWYYGTKRIAKVQNFAGFL